MGSSVYLRADLGLWISLESKKGITTTPQKDFRVFGG